MKITNFKQATEELAKFRPTEVPGTAYKLERMQVLMNYLGNPQNNLRVIHVAGTSGKTSTSYYVAALLKSAGLSVGLSISPHIVQVNERLQVDLVAVDEADFCESLSRFVEKIKSSGVKPTYFELLIAFAYFEFARRKVDYAVMEVGLGGLVDGTNVVDRSDKVCIITDIGLDHMSVLGNTLPEIAFQKAGIIQRGNHVFCHRQAEEVLEVIEQRAEQQHAIVHVIEAASGDQIPGLKALPLFQQRNFQLAERTTNFVLKRDGVGSLTSHQIGQALDTHIPGRMEVLNRQGKTIILDGAHNAQKLHALVDSIAAQFPDMSAATVVSFTASRREQLLAALRELKPLTKTLIATSFQPMQDLPHQPIEPKLIADIAQTLQFTHSLAVSKTSDALNTVLKQPEPLLLITGSFYLISELRPAILQMT